MSEPYLGQIRMVAFNLAPMGHAHCDGQILLINNNQSLFSILGTTFGGDGQDTFALPDLRGRVPIHAGPHVMGGPNRPYGSKGGEDAVVLTLNEVPKHSHELQSTNNLAPLGSLTPAGKVLAGGGTNFYGDFPTPTPMGAGAVTFGGGGQGHANMMPYLTLSFIIALSGAFPTI